MADFNTNRSYRLTTVFAATDVGIYSVHPAEDAVFHSYWDTCREQFAKKFNKKSTGFYFTVVKNKIYNVPNFLEICENLLELKTKTKFFLTEEENVLFIEPAFFWKKCYMRRSLLTLLCRLGLLFEKNEEFENYLFGFVDDGDKEKINSSYLFARQTKNAIMRFFCGNTCYVGAGPDFEQYFPEKHGWVEEFKNKNLKYIKNVLISEKKNMHVDFYTSGVLLS